MDSAVRFLKNPRVQQRALSERTAFLRSKGLTQDEIEMACRRCGAKNTAEKEYSVSTFQDDQTYDKHLTHIILFGMA